MSQPMSQPPQETIQFADLPHARIAYFDLAPHGSEAGTILLIHGFASSARVNWIGTGWTKVLREAGFRVIALDNRGHGESSKFYDAADYGPDIFARDAFDLLDHLKIARCFVMGYSMGTRITCWMVHQAPERIEKAVFGGMGARIFGGRGGHEAVAEALEADDPSTITDPAALSFRTFADRTGSDRLALAACIRPAAVKITPEIVSSLSVPVLVAVGSEDDIGGSALELADMIPGAQGFVIEGLDHLKATGAESYKKAVLEFLRAGSGR